jgi:ADP-heptose:LPS heptosyltransferase
MHRPVNQIAIILPHQLGKLCLVLRLLQAAQVEKRMKKIQLQVYVPVSMITGVKRLGIFNEVFAHTDSDPPVADLVVDLTSYEYSYELASRIKYSSIIRRDLEHPWKIHCQTASGQSLVLCPALTPSLGWFAKDPNASAMLCELPLINLALNFPAEDFTLLRVAQRKVSLLEPINASIQECGYDFADVLLLVGGAHPAKRYPFDCWLELSSRLSALGFRVKALGGPDEKQLMSQLAEKGLSTLLCSDLSSTIDTILQSRLVISNDCGPMHVALMLGKPVLGIFGPTIPESWFVSSLPFQRSLQSERALSFRSDVISQNTCVAWPAVADVIGHSLDLLVTSSKKGHIKSAAFNKSTFITVN